jgi:hypothetical protein
MIEKRQTPERIHQVECVLRQRLCAPVAKSRIGKESCLSKCPKPGRNRPDTGCGQSLGDPGPSDGIVRPAVQHQRNAVQVLPFLKKGDIEQIRTCAQRLEIAAPVMARSSDAANAPP